MHGNIRKNDTNAKERATTKIHLLFFYNIILKENLYGLFIILLIISNFFYKILISKCNLIPKSRFHVFQYM